MLPSDGRIGGVPTEHPVDSQPGTADHAHRCQDTPDEELCAAVRDGSTTAADRLFRRHYRVGVQCARELGAECHTAEDLGSEAFIRLWQRLGRPEPVASVPAYLRMIVRNLYVDTVRQPAPVLSGGLLERDQPSVVDFTDAVVSNEAVRALLSELSDRYRRILELTAILGFSASEAADAMGTTSGAAAVLAYRARRAARAAHLRALEASERSGQPGQSSASGTS